jgi:hypothetical protein
MSEETLPTLPHLASEFYTWLWWQVEEQGIRQDLGGEVGVIDVWIDERLAFRAPGEGRVNVVLTGDNPSGSLEARAAIRGGKILDELQLGIRRDDREYRVTLRGAEMVITGAKLPTVVQDGFDEVLFERMYLVQELQFILNGLYERFAAVRISQEWQSGVVQTITSWIEGDAN